MPTAYVTVPTAAAADLARTLVDRRLAACVNRVDCQSVYRWDDEIHADDETILLAKTTADRYDDLERCIADRHPHDVPCVERFDEADVLDGFADWRADAVSTDG
jgi:periplasmic divalent cation tolerance protein